MSWINNASNIPLNQNSGTLPDMSSALVNWYQPMIFGVITKTFSDFQLIETIVQTQFMGIWQPLKGRQLSMKPEGQRQWSSWQLHADLALNLKIDDVIIYLTKQYRVIAKKDYSLYQFQEYELCEDWEVSGPPTP